MSMHESLVDQFYQDGSLQEDLLLPVFVSVSVGFYRTCLLVVVYTAGSRSANDMLICSGGSWQLNGGCGSQMECTPYILASFLKKRSRLLWILLQQRPPFQVVEVVSVRVTKQEL